MTLFEQLEPSPWDPDDVSPGSQGDTSSKALDDVSQRSSGDGSHVCPWCEQRFTPARRDAVFCSRRCRQADFRLRRRREAVAHADRPKRMAYADPPYPGFAKLYYGDQASFAGEVDHSELIRSLAAAYDGWALSTSMAALRELLPLCPRSIHVCWMPNVFELTPIGFTQDTASEALLVMPGRELRPGKRDFLIAQPARGGGTLMGRKPIAFCAWLFDVLGLLPGDTFDDLFPGTGIVARSWSSFCRRRPIETTHLDASQFPNSLFQDEV